MTDYKDAIKLIVESGKSEHAAALKLGSDLSDVVNTLNRKIGGARSGDNIDLGEEYVKQALAMVVTDGMSNADIEAYKRELRFLDKTTINSMAGAAKAEVARTKDVLNKLIVDYNKAKKRTGTGGMHSQLAYVDEVIIDFVNAAVAADPAGNLAALKKEGLLEFLDTGIASKNLLSDIMTIYNLDNSLYERARINLPLQDEKNNLDSRDVDRTWIGADDLILQFFQPEISKQTDNKVKKFQVEEVVEGAYSPKAIGSDGNLDESAIPKIKRKDGIIISRVPINYANINGNMTLVGPKRDASGEYLLGQTSDGSEFVRIFNYDNDEEIAFDTVRQQWINTVTDPDLIPQISLSSFAKGHVLKKDKLDANQSAKIDVDDALLKAYNTEFNRVRASALESATAADKTMRARAKANKEPAPPTFKRADFIYDIDYNVIANDVARDLGYSRTPDALTLRSNTDMLRDRISSTRILLKEELNKGFANSRSTSGA